MSNTQCTKHPKQHFWIRIGDHPKPPPDQNDFFFVIPINMVAFDPYKRLKTSKHKILNLCCTVREVQHSLTHWLPWQPHYSWTKSYWPPRNIKLHLCDCVHARVCVTCVDNTGARKQSLSYDVTNNNNLSELWVCTAQNRARTAVLLFSPNTPLQSDKHSWESEGKKGERRRESGEKKKKKESALLRSFQDWTAGRG